jgi:hypothetical protein
MVALRERKKIEERKARNANKDGAYDWDHTGILDTPAVSKSKKSKKTRQCGNCGLMTSQHTARTCPY